MPGNNRDPLFLFKFFPSIVSIDCDICFGAVLNVLQVSKVIIFVNVFFSLS